MTIQLTDLRTETQQSLARKRYGERKTPDCVAAEVLVEENTRCMDFNYNPPFGVCNGLKSRKWPL